MLGVGQPDSAQLDNPRDGRFALLMPRSELRGCALCDRLRVQGSLIRVADIDETEAMSPRRAMVSTLDSGIRSLSLRDAGSPRIQSDST